MKSVLISLGLISTTFSSAFALSPPAPISQQKQVSGYYQYQASDVQITALLDGTNFMSPKLFQNIPAKEVHEILKKYSA